VFAESRESRAQSSESKHMLVFSCLVYMRDPTKTAEVLLCKRRRFSSQLRCSGSDRCQMPGAGFFFTISVMSNISRT